MNSSPHQPTVAPPLRSDSVPSVLERTVTVTDLRSVMPEVLHRLSIGGRGAEPVIIKRHREPLAALISIQQYHEYRALLETHRAAA